MCEYKNHRPRLKSLKNRRLRLFRGVTGRLGWLKTWKLRWLFLWLQCTRLRIKLNEKKSIPGTNRYLINPLVPNPFTGTWSTRSLLLSEWDEWKSSHRFECKLIAIILAVKRGMTDDQLIWCNTILTDFGMVVDMNCFYANSAPNSLLLLNSSRNCFFVFDCQKFKLTSRFSFSSASSVSVINDGKYQNSNICEKKMIFIYFALIFFFSFFRLEKLFFLASNFSFQTCIGISSLLAFHIIFLFFLSRFLCVDVKEHYHNNTCHGFIFFLASPVGLFFSSFFNTLELKTLSNFFGEMRHVACSSLTTDRECGA